MMSVIESGGSGGMVGVRDNDGKLKATIVVSDYGNGSIDLLDKNGNKIK